MPSQLSQLAWIDKEQDSMLQLLQAWANINSGSENIAGLAKMTDVLSQSFAKLDGTIKQIHLQARVIINEFGKPIEVRHGKALSIIKRPNAKTKVFLGGHMDTVYPISHSFQKTTRLNACTLQGPGVADMKGGLVVMLKALEAFEQHPLSANIGWEVLINSDEEVGSVGSEPLLIDCARRNTLGLIFEPSFPDGAIVSSRKGSSNLTIIAIGKAAHAGRDFDKGRNAITALAKFIVMAHELTDIEEGITLNFGHISGGGPVNVVPDLAICRLNVRTVQPDDFAYIEDELRKIGNSLESDGLKLNVTVQHIRPPKHFDKKNKDLFEQIKHCSAEEDILLMHRPSGGACDGNLLSAYGLPVIDSLGVIGNHIHTKNEQMTISSLVSRTRLVTLFLLKLASGELGTVK
ncbi:MAG: hydrolase [Parachlamydiaceae bacterium]|nr:hydrolase [Parachlamydiaceae bacterium]